MSWNILFLCTGNSARSILGEALATVRSSGRLRGYSAGSHPTGRVNPFASELCKEIGYPTENLRSKTWDEFAKPDAPNMQLIVTVCDSAAGEACPYWPGHSVSAHWGLPDPAAVDGSDDRKRAAFRAICDAMAKRIDMLLELPFETLADGELRAQMKRIGAQEVLDPAAAQLFAAR